MPRNPPEATEPATIAMHAMPSTSLGLTVNSCTVKVKVLDWHVREYLQPLVARVKVPRCRCHGAG